MAAPPPLAAAALPATLNLFALPATPVLVFRGPPRGAPSLLRGWRTPDPSPTRAGLPGCRGAHIIIEEFPGQADAEWQKAEGAIKVELWPQQCRATRGRSPARRFAVSRTPSPSPVCMPISAFHLAAELPSRTPSPAPRPPRSGGGHELKFGPGAPGPQAPMPERHDEVRTPRGQMAPLMGQLQDASPQSAWVPCGPPPVGLPALALMARPSFTVPAAAATAPWGGPGAPPAPPAPPSPPAAATPASAEAEPLESIGSAGHPYTCAEACKYAKKPRGCKDGAACARCHQCGWHRYWSKRSTDKKGRA